MKILFLGPYRQFDGWGYASKQYLRALRLTGKDISSYPLYLNNIATTFDKTDEFNECENNKQDKYDVIIQHALPNFMRKYGESKCIGLSHFESTVKYTPWVPCIEMMDEIWTSSPFEIKILRDDVKVLPENGIPQKKYKILPIPVDVNKFKKSYEPPSLIKNKDTFKFYFIGEYSSRKNIDLLIKAFFIEFLSYENVELIIKTNFPSMSNKNAQRLMNGIVNEITLSLNFYTDPSKVKISTDFLTEDEINGLHQHCDCFVSTANAEGFCIPALDAIGFGSRVICNEKSGSSQYVRAGLNGYTVTSNKVPAVSTTPRPISYLYTGRDHWYEMNIDDLMFEMRSVFNDGKNVITGKNNIVNDYSYERVAQRLGELL